MMLINGRNEVFMVDRDNSVFHIDNLEFPFRKDPSIHLANTLLDGVSYSYLVTLLETACFFTSHGFCLLSYSRGSHVSPLIYLFPSLR